MTLRVRGGVKSVFVFGAGKVGRALARALRGEVAVTLHPAREGLPRKRIDALALRAITDTMPLQREGARKLIRRLRDGDRY